MLDKGTESQIIFLGNGPVKVSMFLNVNGQWIGQLQKHKNFPHNPSFVTYFDTFFNIAKSDLIGYGARYQALFVPEITGDYTFYIAAGRQAVLYLGKNDKESSKTEICVGQESAQLWDK